ncbi:MAG TPA: c-type cytochrome [Rhodocyclaceae bacterium]|nr:c-type cytochrome [Rhodocyclaceae bacterium]
MPALLVSALALAASAAVAAEPKEIAATVCLPCHGEAGNSVLPTFPKLAGQQKDYLLKQLQEFASGKRKNEIMAPIISTVDKGDFAGLAAYFSAQPQSPGTVEDALVVEAGKKLYEDGNTDTGVPACVGCHQPNAMGNERFPRLAGQHQTYTRQQMANFKAGARTNDKGKIMRAVAERMSEQEMKAVSEYIAGLK